MESSSLTGRNLRIVTGSKQELFQCSKSTNYSSKYLQDTNYDGTLCHSIQYRSGDKRYMLVGPRTSVGSTIVPGSNANTLVIQDHRRRTSIEVLKNPETSSRRYTGRA
ncbi:hypothetical protein Q7C36_014978 [Tachysurus vachellii]|uniref:Uncharacterized protein n=1 Tax=Tachysurus vachellii TaxID=175792 RepID=A0AA88MC77_TACVA|nr:hypothetical protein Q7C36_014978 [Tachysurus vachellii]